MIFGHGTGRSHHRFITAWPMPLALPIYWQTAMYVICPDWQSRNNWACLFRSLITTTISSASCPGAPTPSSPMRMRITIKLPTRKALLWPKGLGRKGTDQCHRGLMRVCLAHSLPVYRHPQQGYIPRLGHTGSGAEAPRQGRACHG